MLPHLNRFKHLLTPVFASGEYMVPAHINFSTTKIHGWYSNLRQSDRKSSYLPLGQNGFISIIFFYNMCVTKNICLFYSINHISAIMYDNKDFV